MKKIILIGNPNTGKTTLFNSMTKSNEHVGNWHGVTVRAKEKVFLFKGEELAAIDLPGMNSFNTISFEEKIAANEILKSVGEKKDDFKILNICDSGNLAKNLYLTMQLIERKIPIVIVLNMANESKNSNKIAQRLTEKLGVLVETIDARKSKQVSSLVEKIKDLKLSKPKNQNYFNQLENETNVESIEKNAEKRHSFISELLSGLENPASKLQKLDNLLFNKAFSIPLFIAIISVIFFITFGAMGDFFSELIEKYVVKGVLGQVVVLVSKISDYEWITDLTHNVLIIGVGSVISFLPQMILLYLMLSILEDMGYMSRIAFMFDGFFKLIGLSGRSIFSLLTGFGCTTSAILSTRSLESKRLRKKTTLMLPFLGCSAKMPIFLLLCSVFFAKTKFLILLLIYSISIIISILILFLIQQTAKFEHENFLMEMPKLRFPTLKKILKNTATNAKDFASRVMFVVAVSCVAIWMLSNFDFRFGYVNQTGTTSVLESISKLLAPIFVPLGFGSWGIVIAVIFGMIARELVVSTFGMLNNAENKTELEASIVAAGSVVCFSTSSSFSFLIFLMLFTPCFPALSMTRKELGIKWTMFLAVFQFGVAYICSFFVFNLFKFNWIFKWLMLFVLFALVACLMLKLKNKNKKENLGCNQCQKKCKEKEKWLHSKMKMKNKGL